MRLLLLGAVLAVGAIVFYMVSEDPAGRREREQPGCGETEVPDKVPLPDPAVAPRAFIEQVTQEHLQDLVARLTGGGDRQLLPRWKFTDEGLEGFPTLRSVLITALARIEGPEAGKALLSALARTESLEESCLIVLFLRERRETGWEATAIERAAAESAAPQRDVRLRLLEAAVESAPAAVVDHLVTKAPRGDDPRRPRLMARSLTMLPAGQAEAAGQRLLADKDVTPAAKGLYLRAFMQREETATVTTLTALAERGALDERTITDAAYAVANAGAFQADKVAYQRALAAGKADEAARIRERNRLRVREARRFIKAALGIDVDTSDDKRAAALKKLLGHNELR